MFGYDLKSTTIKNDRYNLSVISGSYNRTMLHNIADNTLYARVHSRMKGVGTFYKENAWHG